MAQASSTRKNKNKLALEFCRCIKKVRNSVTLRPGQAKTAAAKEAAAIAICVKSVLQTKGRTLKQFRCGGPKGPYLQTQKPLRGGAVLLGNPMPAANEPNKNEKEAPPSQGILERISSLLK